MAKKITCDHYTFSLYFKQGDDLAPHVEQTKTASEALQSWSRHFAGYQEQCLQVAQALEGKKIEIDAQVHHIEFHPKDETAKAALKALAKKKLISYEKETFYE